MVTIIMFFCFCSSKLINRIKPKWLRCVLLFVCIIISMICTLPSWRFNKYDHEKINSYTRLLPFKNSPYVNYRETIFYNNIKGVKYFSGGDSGSSMRLLVNSGRNLGIEISSISRKTLDNFLVNLYDECIWLRDNLENEFGPIERRRENINNTDRKLNFNLIHFILFAFFIFAIIVGVIGLIIFTLKIKESFFKRDKIIVISDQLSDFTPVG